MGACDLDKEDIEYLKSASAPKIVNTIWTSNDNTLKLSFMLSPWKSGSSRFFSNDAGRSLPHTEKPAGQTMFSEKT